MQRLETSISNREKANSSAKHLSIKSTGIKVWQVLYKSYWIYYEVPVLKF